MYQTCDSSDDDVCDTSSHSATRTEPLHDAHIEYPSDCDDVDTFNPICLTDDTDKECQKPPVSPSKLRFLYIAFERHYDTTLKKIVHVIAGTHIHCEMVTLNGNNVYAHAAYMNESFSRNQINEQDYSQATHDILRLAVDEKTYAEVLKKLGSIVQKQIPYNYADALTCPLPMQYFRTDAVTIDTLKSVFCSQSVIMVIRETFPHSHEAYHAVAKMNSRTTSPNTLYKTLQPIAEKASVIQMFT